MAQTQLRHIIIPIAQVSKLEDRLKVSKTDAENAKRELRNEQDGRAILDKKIKGEGLVYNVIDYSVTVRLLRTIYFCPALLSKYMY